MPIDYAVFVCELLEKDPTTDISVGERGWEGFDAKVVGDGT